MTPLPAQTAALLGHGVSEGLIVRLLASERLAARLLDVLEARLGPLPPLDPAQTRVLAMDAEALADLSRQAGAVWHGNAIAALVDGAAVRALTGAIGAELRTLALRGLALSQPAAMASPEAIAAALPGAGAACLVDWCASQPTPVAARLALRLSDASPGRTGGAAIIAWLLGQQ